MGCQCRSDADSVERRASRSPRSRAATFPAHRLTINRRRCDRLSVHRFHARTSSAPPRSGDASPRSGAPTPGADPHLALANSDRTAGAIRQSRARGSDVSVAGPGRRTRPARDGADRRPPRLRHPRHLEPPPAPPAPPPPAPARPEPDTDAPRRRRHRRARRTRARAPTSPDEPDTRRRRPRRNPTRTADVLTPTARRRTRSRADEPPRATSPKRLFRVRRRDPGPRPARPDPPRRRCPVGSARPQGGRPHLVDPNAIQARDVGPPATLCPRRAGPSASPPEPGNAARSRQPAKLDHSDAFGGDRHEHPGQARARLAQSSVCIAFAPARGHLVRRAPRAQPRHTPDRIRETRARNTASTNNRSISCRARADQTKTQKRTPNTVTKPRGRRTGGNVAR